MAKLYLIAVIIASTLVSLISADDNSDPIADKLTQIKAMIDFSVIFYVLAFILWIIGLALTNKKKIWCGSGSNVNDNKEKDKSKLEINNWAVVDILLKLNGFISNIMFILNSIIIVILSGAWNFYISLLAVASQPFYTFCVRITKICCCFCWFLCFYGRKKKCNDCKKHNAEEFLGWLKDNKFVATILIACSFISLEFFEFSNSKWGGLKTFNSKMNRFGKIIVFYGAIVNIFIRDVPKLVIQIIYRETLKGNQFMLALNGLIIFVAIISRILYGIILIFSRSKEKCNHNAYVT
ncbi:13536_t:CDS:2 [Rhizophagus irregularis]|nr:13536_t:CDS:2 [Rhizophagus irregularis]